VSAIRHIPNEALDDYKVEGVLANTLAVWLQNWFSTPIYRKLIMNSKSEVPDGFQAQHTWSEPNGDIQLLMNEENAITLAGFCLGRRIGGSRLNEADQSLVLHLVNDAVEQLLQLLSTSFPLVPVLSKLDSGSFHPTKGSNYAWCLELNEKVNLGYLTIAPQKYRELRIGMVKPLGSAKELVSLEHAAQKEVLEIGAYLGQARVSARELSKMMVGDVLVLNASTTMPSVTTVNHVPITDWPCSLVIIDNQAPSLNLQAPRGTSSL
jgi:hypothetical protein